uniref:Uncharacterized protein n=1 Tax=Plectus sambesii TaxID=2011161 RepID=A0A914VW85_9BILA
METVARNLVFANQLAARRRSASRCGCLPVAAATMAAGGVAGDRRRQRTTRRRATRPTDMTGGAPEQANAGAADKAPDDAGDEIGADRPKSRALRGPGRHSSTSAAARATTRTGRTERNTAALIDTRTSARLFLCASMHRRFVDIPRDKALATGVISAATVSNYFKPQSPRKRAGLAFGIGRTGRIRHRPTPLVEHGRHCDPTFSPHHQQFMSAREKRAPTRSRQPPAGSRHTLGYAAQSKTPFNLFVEHLPATREAAVIVGSGIDTNSTTALSWTMTGQREQQHVDALEPLEEDRRARAAHKERKTAERPDHGFNQRRYMIDSASSTAAVGQSGATADLTHEDQRERDRCAARRQKQQMPQTDTTPSHHSPRALMRSGASTVRRVLRTPDAVVVRRSPHAFVQPRLPSVGAPSTSATLATDPPSPLHFWTRSSFSFNRHSGRRIDRPNRAR